MDCTNCNNDCQETNTCDCPLENYTDCIKTREGYDNDCLAIEEGENLKSILRKIIDKVCSVTNNLIQFVNIGTGAKVYKGYSASNDEHQFRTLTSNNPDLTITETLEELVLDYNPEPISINSITSVGGGEPIYKGTNLEEEEFKTIQNSVSINVSTPTQETIAFQVDETWLNTKILEWVNNNNEILCEVNKNCPCTDTVEVSASFTPCTGNPSTGTITIIGCPDTNYSLQLVAQNGSDLNKLDVDYLGDTYTISSTNLSNTIPVLIPSSGTLILNASLIVDTFARFGYLDEEDNFVLLLDESCG